MRNGVMIRSEQNYDHDRCGDLYGNKATKAWNPRGCPKGFTMQRRVYGPYRLKGPVLRNGWKQWVDAGCPSLSDNPELRTKYKFDDRGNDSYVRVSWDEVSKYVADALHAIAGTYSGDDGARATAEGRLRAADDRQGGRCRHADDEDRLEPADPRPGRQVRHLSLRQHARSAGSSRPRRAGGGGARGARDWNEYTWRGDQAPGHPFVHGLQTSDMDFNDMRFCKLVIQIGKNLIENKMPESHWLNECMERGAKLVDIAPEYNCPATKSDYWIGVRPGLSDMAVLLGVTKIMLDNDWYKPDFCRQFTDFPLLVRTDTLAASAAAGRAGRLSAEGHQRRPVLQSPGPDRRAAGEDRRLLRVGQRHERGGVRQPR